MSTLFACGPRLTPLPLSDTVRKGFSLTVKQTLWRLILFLAVLAMIAALLLVSLRDWR